MRQKSQDEMKSVSVSLITKEDTEEKFFGFAY